MKRKTVLRTMFLGLGILMFAIAPLTAFAGSGHNEVRQDGHVLHVTYKSTEEGPFSWIDHIEAKASVPGARYSAQVCAQASIYFRGTRVFRSAQKCSMYGPGFSHAVHSWKLYPDSPRDRRRVPRGDGEVKIDYSYIYSGTLNNGNCANGLCGTASVSVKVS